MKLLESYGHTQAKKIISQLYFWGLVMMIISIPLSRFTMSVAQFTLSGIIILDFFPLEKFISLLKRRPIILLVALIIPQGLWWTIQSIIHIFKKFFRRDNLPAIVFFSLFVLHLLGLVFTVDFDYALKDLRIKLPLLVLPIIFTVSAPLDWKKFRTLMLFFVAAVVAGTLISTYILLTQDVDNLREISIFISHIRFSLLIGISLFTLGYFGITQVDFPKHYRVIMLLFCAWLLIYLVLSASMTGLIVLLLAIFVVTIIYTLKKRNIYSRIATVSMLLIPIILGVYLIGIISDVYKVHKVDFSKLEMKTALGNLYQHDTSLLQTENGYYVWLYVAPGEMKEAWNKRSDLDFDGYDNKGQQLKYTLIRYLTSKGYRKDAAGVNSLSEEDLCLIEDGEANAHYHERSEFYIRLYKIIWETQEYFRTGDPSGHSTMQRIEYWKTSCQIFKQYPIFGVGTGDMNIAFERQYEIMNSPLKLEYRWRSHNQFLSISVGFGLIGILWFIFALLYPPIKTRRMTDYFYLSFFVIMMASMISEDTIETQAGVTIFAFFTSLFLFGKKDKTVI